MMKRLETIIPKAETAFKVLYILLVLLSFTNLMVGNPVLRYYTYALVLFGAVLLYIALCILSVLLEPEDFGF